MSDVRARERRGEKARRYGGVLICRRRALRRHCRAKSIGLRLRNDSRNTGSDSGIPVATVFQADKFSTGHTIDRRRGSGALWLVFFPRGNTKRSVVREIPFQSQQFTTMRSRDIFFDNRKNRIFEWETLDQSAIKID